jgi:membrane protease YdiL (CAAX protease family)
MQTPENDLIHSGIAGLDAELGQRRSALDAPRHIAPAWHTVVLIVGILAISFAGSKAQAVQHRGGNRLLTYGTTAALELGMLGWVALGLWLRKTPFRSLFGALKGSPRGFALDVGIALVFWIGSLMVLGSLGILWTTVEFAVAHGGEKLHAGQKLEPSESQQQTVRALEQLAPENGKEIAWWVLLCFTAGFVEEAVFRGYLQQQFTAWGRGNAAAGVVFSALMFGAAHGYQGVRNMVLLGVFGVLFSLLAIFRRNLRPGILAHGGHDLIAGLALAYLRTHRLI